jgi:biopolymer transport protein ExbB/TolQ
MQGTVSPQVAVRRRFAPLGVFLVGLGLTAAFYAIVTGPSLRGTMTYRYFCGHPICEWTTWLFIWGITALGWKAYRLMAERRVARSGLDAVPVGRAIRVADLPKMLEVISTLPAATRDTWLARRLAAALGYVAQQGSANGLEERLESLAVRDAEELDGSYELVRTITWAIPILGFLGTVVGITIAIANITPDQLQNSLSDVVGGLAVAFDTTALALALSMGIVLAKFLVERGERAMLSEVDKAVEDAVLHRFERHAPETQAFLSTIEGVADVVMQATRDAWREQGQLWTRAIEQVGESQIAAIESTARGIVEQIGIAGRQLAADQIYQYADIQKRQQAMLDAQAATLDVLREVGREWIGEARDAAQQNAIEHETQFARFLASMNASGELWQRLASETATHMIAHHDAVKRQTDVLTRLLADQGRLVSLQQSLDQNLAAIAHVQALDEAIHSLSAATHLLTARLGRVHLTPVFSANDRPLEAAA